MTDRYEHIRRALAMGPTRGIRYARGQEVGGPCGVGVAWCGTNMTSGRDGSYSIGLMEACANASLAAACDPDTIQELLAERDQLADALEATQAEVEALRAEAERLDRLLGRIVEGDGDPTLVIRVGPDAFAAAREYLSNRTEQGNKA